MLPWVLTDTSVAVTVTLAPLNAIPEDPAPVVMIVAPSDIVTLVLFDPGAPAANPIALVPLVWMEPPEKLADPPSQTSSPCDQKFVSGKLLPPVETARLDA